MNLQRNFNALLGGLAVGGREMQRIGVEQAAKKEIAAQQLEREMLAKEKANKVANYKKQIGDIAESLKKGHEGYLADKTPENQAPDPFALRRSHGQFMKDYEDTESIYESLVDLDPTDENIAAFNKFKEVYGGSYGNLGASIEVGEDLFKERQAQFEQEETQNTEFEHAMEKKKKAAESLEAEVRGKQTQAADVRTLEQKLIDEYTDKFGF